jgi:hypothetical protein
MTPALIPWLINPNHGRNAPHPQSYGAQYPLRHSESFGGRAHETLPGTFRVTKAEQARLAQVKAMGAYIPRAERAGGTITEHTAVRPRRRLARAAAPRARLVPRATERPVKRHTHWHTVRKHKRRTNPSPAQIAARKRFAAAARAGTLKKGRKLTTRTARASVSRNPSRYKEAGPMARRKRRRRTTAAASHRRRRSVRSNPRRRRRRNPAMRMASRRRRHRVHARNPRRRRHHRRNPGIRGIGGQVMAAAKTTAIILVASAATKKISAMIPLGQGTPATGTTPATAGNLPLAIAVQVAVGVGLAAAARKFAPRFAGDVLVGAMLAPMTTLLMQVPVVGPALSGAPPGLGLFSGRPVRPVRSNLRGAPPGLGVWGPRNAAGAGALPRAAYYNG